MLFVIVTICFLVDLILNLFAFGFSQTFKNWEYIIESILQVVSWILPVCFVIRSIQSLESLQETYIDYMVIVLIIRSLRLLNYMFELKDFQIMARTFKNLSAPFASMMLTFYCVMFIYAVVGIYFFNGLITRATML